jgi:hypothetical protein
VPELKRLAVDPGDVHVGWAYDGQGAVETGEWSPEDTCNIITWMMTRNTIDELILERFNLYADKAEEQIGSSFKTSQLIGALKWIAYCFRIPVVEQGADIKTPTRNQLRGRKIRQIGVGGHARDAELHLYYRRLRPGRS